MAGMSNYLENKLADWKRGQAFPAAPANTFVALYTCTNGILARSTAYTAGQTVVVLATDARYHLYSVTTAGTTAATAPTYTGTLGETITDGTAVLTEQDATVDAGTAVEVTGGAYARASIPGTLAGFTATQGGTAAVSSGTSGQSANGSAITFPTATANWATSPAMVWGFGIYDAATAGNLIDWGPLGAPQYVLTGATLSFAAGVLTVTYS